MPAASAMATKQMSTPIAPPSAPAVTPSGWQHGPPAASVPQPALGRTQQWAAAILIVLGAVAATVGGFSLAALVGADAGARTDLGAAFTAYFALSALIAALAVLAVIAGAGIVLRVASAPIVGVIAAGGLAAARLGIVVVDSLVYRDLLTWAIALAGSMVWVSAALVALVLLIRRAAVAQ